MSGRSRQAAAGHPGGRPSRAHAAYDPDYCFIATSGFLSTIPAVLLADTVQGLTAGSVKG